MAAMIESFLPEYDFRAAQSQWVDADPGAVWSALTTVRFDELVLTRPLARVRGLAGRLPTGSVLHDGPVTLLRVDEGREAVGGAITRSWPPRRARAIPGEDYFTAFRDPGWVKLATDFRLVAEVGGTRLSTETRMQALDPGSRRSRLHWAGLRTLTAVLRRDVLASVARKATAASRP